MSSAPDASHHATIRAALEHRRRWAEVLHYESADPYYLEIMAEMDAATLWLDTLAAGQGLEQLVSDEQVIAATSLPSPSDYVDMVTMRKEVFAIRQRYETERKYLFAEVAAQTQHIATLEADVEELEAEAEGLANECNMLFDRAAKRLARIKELEAELAEARKPMRVIVQPDFEIDLEDDHA